MMKHVSILGSTGSIGRQSLDVIEQLGGINVVALTAGTSVDMMADQCRKFVPELAVMASEEAAKKLAAEISDLPTRVSWGEAGLIEAAELPAADCVITAVVGMVGLKPTLAAIRAHKRIGLANKETLVCAGEIVMREAKKEGVEIIPVDSEHSAIFQCLMGNAEKRQVKKIILTCSGGPFFGKKRDELKHVTRADALKHPNWKMGAKITIDCSTLMNKGLEVIEAMRLYDVPLEQVQVLIHRQSIVHSMVEYVDGAVMAQLGAPDMRLPIQYAFSYPQRLSLSSQRLDFSTLSSLTFEQPDPVRFRNLALSFEALKRGGNMPCILNAANEVCVAAFLKERIGFLQMSDVIEQTMQRICFIKSPTYDDYVATDAAARRIAEELITHNS